MIYVEYGLHGESNKLACIHVCQASPDFNLEITTIII